MFLMDFIFLLFTDLIHSPPLQKSDEARNLVRYKMMIYERALDVATLTFQRGRTIIRNLIWNKLFSMFQNDPSGERSRWHHFANSTGPDLDSKYHRKQQNCYVPKSRRKCEDHLLKNSVKSEDFKNLDNL